MRSALLPALAAFASAARHQNFAHAAEELHLTASAVSHHVRKLEVSLGVSLFQRHARGVALTPEGRLLADAAGSALADVESVLDSLRQHRRENGLRLSVLPSLAANWLTPRLRRFIDAHPDIRLSIDTDRALARFDEGGPDLGIRYGFGQWSGVTSRFLMNDSLQPLASPELAARVQDICDVAALPLLTDIAPEGWREWFKAAGVRYPRKGTVHTISDSADSLNAAAIGLGAVLARTRLATAHLADGRLVRLPGPELPTRFAYYVAHSAHRPPSAAALAFIGWIEREAQEPRG
ncbi:LysR substrate-binding domain-containing protein [Luteibacter yeojuensis]|uniref:LysR family transcriptional regulator n=1 Tax=Luteibacter yeojuensis TaxID=345309 RepID=A0A7X5TNY8_9GAMM|nr:LysR substrate-binding domain-containing protein [Luteibacter yeojuensis]NID14238.1 LysR family transcriptional regulator [Luteibacter yeojuensis]